MDVFPALLRQAPSAQPIRRRRFLDQESGSQESGVRSQESGRVCLRPRRNQKIPFISNTAGAGVIARPVHKVTPILSTSQFLIVAPPQLSIGSFKLLESFSTSMNLISETFTIGDQLCAPGQRPSQDSLYATFHERENDGNTNDR
jgi:hypothetical protein